MMTWGYNYIYRCERCNYENETRFHNHLKDGNYKADLCKGKLRKYRVRVETKDNRMYSEAWIA